MCGIVGFFHKDLTEDHLLKMTRCLVHRGPDAGGSYFDASSAVGLGHRRLSILDLSPAGNQPFYSKDGRYVMVYNGEVYNFKDLIAAYGLQTETGTDTEVILELFSKFGLEIVKEFNGMFAMAIWDIHERELFLFRDRFGIKPLFYHWENNQLTFSSELKGILTDLPQKLEIDYSSLGYYFHLGFIPCPHTIYKNVYKLQPGGVLRIKNKEMKLETFVSLTDPVKQNVFSDEKEVFSKLDDLLLKAVERQNIADVPVGVFLSGGTDSSLLAALTREVSKEKVKTFSVGFQNSMFDELPYAAKVAKYLGTEHYELHVTDKQMLDNLYEIIDAYDEPYIIAAAFPAFSISAFTRKHVTVALSGEGADEMFMGYGFHSWAERMSRFPLKQFGTLIGTGLGLSPRTSHKQKAGLFKDPDKYSRQSHIFSREQYYFSIDDIGKNFSPKCGFDVLKHLSLNLPKNRIFNAQEAQSWFDINLYLVDDLLTKVDRASMHYGLEARVPFLDNDLFNYVINIDSQLKLNGSSAKYILKKVLYKYIPQSFFNRPKWGFSPPLAKWMKTDLRPVVEEYMDPQIIKKFGLVDADYATRLKNEYYNGNERQFNKLWLLVLIHIWLVRNT